MRRSLHLVSIGAINDVGAALLINLSVRVSLVAELLSEVVQNVEERSLDAQHDEGVDQNDDPNQITEVVAIFKSDMLVDCVAESVKERSEVLGRDENDDAEQEQSCGGGVGPKERVAGPLSLTLAQGDGEDGDQEARDHDTVDVHECNGEVEVQTLQQGDEEDTAGEWETNTAPVVVRIGRVDAAHFILK